MVNTARKSRGRKNSFVTVELTIAIALFISILLPLGFSFVLEQRLFRAYYFRAVAGEIVDGEMEVLAAGEWEEYEQGSQNFSVTLASAECLPAGQFTLTVQPGLLRLEWSPENPGAGGTVRRERKLAHNSADHP